MSVILLFLHCFEVLVSISIPKVDYIEVLEKDKSTNGMSHYTNGEIRTIYGAMV
jgi:hypothetical protein